LIVSLAAPITVAFAVPPPAPVIESPAPLNTVSEPLEPSTTDILPRVALINAAVEAPAAIESPAAPNTVPLPLPSVTVSLPASALTMAVPVRPVRLTVLLLPRMSVALPAVAADLTLSPLAVKTVSCPDPARQRPAPRTI
jgi:hypothetical protein